LANWTAPIHRRQSGASPLWWQAQGATATAQKNEPDAISSFKAEIVEKLKSLIPTETSKPLRLFAHDESRWNLRTIRRRRITARGVKPIAVTQYERGGCWLYGSIDPDSGDAFWLLLPQLNAANMQIFLDELAAAYAESFNILLIDNAGAHTAQSLQLPATIALLFQPPRCPEVNPAERVWEDLRGKLAWQRFTHIDLLEDEIGGSPQPLPASDPQIPGWLPLPRPGLPCGLPIMLW
jgi:hypothetical protein